MLSIDLHQAPRAIAMDRQGGHAVYVDDYRVMTFSINSTNTPVHVASLPSGVATDPISVAIHGNRVAVGEGVGRLLIWDIGTNIHMTLTQIGHGAITVLQFDTDGNRLFVGCESGFACIVSAADLGNRILLSGHLEAVRAASWSPDGARIFTASSDGSVRIWPTTAPFLAGEVSPFLVLTEPSIPGSPTAILLTPDGERLACGYDDGSVRVWDSVPWSERAKHVPPLFPVSPK